MARMKLQFTKMQGAGNDFVVIDASREALSLSPEQLRRLGDRRFGVGCDQILVIERSSSPGVDFRYRIFKAAAARRSSIAATGRAVSSAM